MCTVKELIEKLKECSEDAIVYVIDCSTSSTSCGWHATWEELNFVKHLAYYDLPKCKFEAEKIPGKTLYLGNY